MYRMCTNSNLILKCILWFYKIRKIGKVLPRHQKASGILPEAFRFLMRGGDSEFINYLKYILQRKCVHFVFKK